MLEREGGNDRQTDYEAFNKIIDAAQFQDAGISEFEDVMLREQEALIKFYLGEDYSESEYDDYINDVSAALDEEWPHMDAKASVSGRVYLLDRDQKEIAPESWGVAREEADGSISYLIDDATLYSRGINVIHPISRDEDALEGYSNYANFADRQDDDSIVSVCHLFEAESDNGESVIVIARPGDLWRHAYDNLTPEGVEARLSYDWPSEFKQLKKIIKPDMYAMAVPRRITELVKRVGEQLGSSDEFRNLAELYIEHTVGFDDIAPYILKVSGAVSLSVSTNENGEANPGGWREYGVNGEMTIIGHSPAVRFLPDPKSKTVDAGFMVGVFNDERPNTPEWVFVSLDSLVEFRSSRAIQSLASRAVQQSLPVDDQEAIERLRDSLLSLSGVSADEANLQFIGNKSTGELVDEKGNLPSSSGSLASPDYESDSTEASRILASISSGERYEKYKLIEDFTQEMIKIGKRLRRVVADTPEDARALAAQEVDKFIGENPRYSELAMDGTVKLRVSGEVIVGRIDPELIHRVKSDFPDLDFIGIDSNNQYGQIPELEHIDGRLHGIDLVVADKLDDDGDVVGYLGTPAFIIRTGSVSREAASYQGVPLVRSIRQSDAIVYLDGTTNVEVSEADYYRGVESAVAKVASNEELSRFGTSETVAELAGHLVGEIDDYASVDLGRVDLINQVGADIVNAEISTKSRGEVLAAVDVLLSDRYVNLYAEGFTVQGDTRYPAQLTGAFVQVVDVRADVLDDDTVMAVALNNQIVYVPFAKISRLLF